MHYFVLAIPIVLIISIVFIKYRIIQRYSIKKTLYYMISIGIGVLIVEFLGVLFNFQVKKDLKTLLISIPFVLIILYLEKFFIKTEKD